MSMLPDPGMRPNADGTEQIAKDSWEMDASKTSKATLKDAVILIRRLLYQLDVTNTVRQKAVDWLMDTGNLPSPIREDGRFLGAQDNDVLRETIKSLIRAIEIEVDDPELGTAMIVGKAKKLLGIR